MSTSKIFADELLNIQKTISSEMRELEKIKKSIKSSLYNSTNKDDALKAVSDSLVQLHDLNEIVVIAKYEVISD